MFLRFSVYLADVGYTVSGVTVRPLRKVPENLSTLPSMMAFGAFQDGSEDEIVSVILFEFTGITDC